MDDIASGKTSESRESKTYEGCSHPWRSMKSILDSRLFSTVYVWLFVIPFMVKVFEAVPTRMVLFGESKEPLPISLALPFSWYLVYFAAVAFSFSRFLYSSYCPRFLAKYSSPSTAVRDGVDSVYVKEEAARFAGAYFNSMPAYYGMMGIRLASLLDELRAPWQDIRRAWLDEFKWDETGILLHCAVMDARIPSTSKEGFYELPEKNRLLPACGFVGEQLERVDAEQYMRTISWRLIDLQDYSYPRVRLVTFISLCLGMIFLLVPVIQNFVYIIIRFASEIS